MLSCDVCVSVCLSVCVSHVRTFCQNFIFEIFSLSGSHTILVFPYQTAWRYSDGNSLNGGVECRWGRQKSRFWSYIWLHCLLLTLQQARCCQYHLSLVVSGCVDSGKRRRNIYDKKPQRYATDNRIAHLTARSDKFVAYVTNNKNKTSNRVFYC